MLSFKKCRNHKDLNYSIGIIISGGPSSVTDANAPQLSKEIFNLDVPILGICWGMQFMNYSHGGEVKKLDKREDGVFEIDIQTSKLFKNLGTAKQFCNFHNFAIFIKSQF